MQIYATTSSKNQIKSSTGGTWGVDTTFLSPADLVLCSHDCDYTDSPVMT